MSLRKKPPFRADQVGSLLRPAALLDARDKFEKKQISAEALKRAEDEAIRDVVKRQEDIGLQCVTDGEFRRESWHMEFLSKIGGIGIAGTQLRPFKNESGDVRNEILLPEVTGRIHLEKTIFGEDFTFLKSVSTKAVPKLTIPSPSILHGLGVLENPAVYSDVNQILEDLVKVYSDLLTRLGELGCTYLQIDDTMFATLGDPSYRDKIRTASGDPDARHLMYIKLINDIVSQRPEGMTICVHTCRGNHRSGWVAAGSYDPVAEAVFSELKVDGLFLEYDDARSGGFEPLRFIPKGKVVVLGLVTTKKGALEKKDDLKRRIDEASKYVDLDQICLSPQCGFASTALGNLLTHDQQFAKLRLIVETANEVWG